MKIAGIKERLVTPVESSNPRINNFNIIRFTAAIMVLYGHMAAVIGIPKTVVLGQDVSTIGVKILFVISGFLITKSFLNDSNFLRYMVRRSFRIFPGLIAVTFFAVFIIGPVMTALPIKDYFRDANTWLYLKNIILFPIYNLPGVFGGNYPLGGAINGSLWSLPVEFIMYLLLPLFIVIFKKIKIMKSGIIAVAVVFLAANVIKTIFFPSARIVFYGTDWMQALSLIPYFFIGSLWSFPEMKRFFNIQVSTFLIVSAAFLSLDYAKSEILVAILLPYFIFSFAYVEKPFFGNWFSKCDFSYGLYLFSFPIQQIVYHQLQKRFNASLNVSSLICFVITLVAAMLSWYIIEKPAQNLGKRILAKLTKR